jgi:hypothetical protein
MKYRVVFEGRHGPVLDRVLALNEIAPYVWPGWLPLWETKDGEDVLSLLSPERIAFYRELARSAV